MSMILGVVVVGVAIVAGAGSLTEVLQARVAELTPAQQEALLALLSGGSDGEATAEAATPEDAIRSQLEKLGKGMAEGDIEAIMAVHSDDFEHYDVGGKEEMREYLEQAIDMGYLEEAKVVLDDAEFEVDGDEIIVYPVDLESPLGSVTLEYVFKNEGGTWRIVTGDASGV